MSENQQHGKAFETLIRDCGLFRGASEFPEPSTAKFDISARFDPAGLPTSIKATSNRVIAMADARRFWELDCTIRLIVGRYRQTGSDKRFDMIHEFILTAEDLGVLRGDITSDDVARLHSGIGPEAFPIGQHGEARAWAKQEKKALVTRATQTTLSPKIDSKKQRRLQCSVTIDAVMALTSGTSRHTVHANRFGDLALPLIVSSSLREFGL